MQKQTIAILALAVMSLIIVSSLAALNTTSTISSSGTIATVGVQVYSDNTGITVLSSISWGALNPGDVEGYTIYVKNTGAAPVTLSMTTSNWTPPTASSYITLTWNQENNTNALPTGQSVQAVLSLNVSSTVNGITGFSFDITISGIAWSSS